MLKVERSSVVSRTQLLNAIASKRSCQSYLEIGVADGTNFNEVKCPHKVGVDPDPNARSTSHLTSDEFFASNAETFDLIFIDGLHHADQVLRDIHNSMLCLRPGGTIVLHDCSPTTEAMQAVPRIQGEWTGDVWKAFVTTRSKFGIFGCVVDIDYGCGVLVPSRTSERLIINDQLTWENLVLHRRHWLNLVSASWFVTSSLRNE